MSDATVAETYVDLDRQEFRWFPPEGVTTHSRNPIEPTTDFFVVPPPEIGELVSADSSLKTTSRPWKTASRIVLTGLIGWGGYMLADALSKNAFPINQLQTYTIVLCFTIVLMPISWFLTRFSGICSYVGKDGIARMKCAGARDRMRPQEILLFVNVAELRNSETRMYQKGVYTGTAYQFKWTDTQGNKVFKLSGTYRGEKKPPKPKDPFHFAQKADEIWTAYLYDRYMATLQDHRVVRFPLNGHYYVAIGEGFLDILVCGTELIHLTSEEIAGIQFDSGVVKIKTIDAQEGWFSSTGVYKFSYSQMANARLFLQFYSRWIGK